MKIRGFPIRPAYEFASANGLAAEAARIRAIPSIPGFRCTGVRRAHMIELLTDKGLLHKFLEEHWLEGHSDAGQAKMGLYVRRRIMYESLVSELAEEDDEDDSPESDAEDNTSSVFAYERDLQNFLARNLRLLEPGLELYSDERGSGIEYPVDGGRIDLLAKSSDDTLVVIEMKLSKGRSKAIGQLLYYMGWVDSNLSPSKPCRGVLIAKDIGEDVVTAIRRTQGVELFQYNLQVALEKISVVP